MEIINAVVHRLNKIRNMKGASVVPATEELARNDALDHLLSQVLESYNARSARHVGVFEDDEDVSSPVKRTPQK